MRKGENRSYLYCNWGERLNCLGALRNVERS